ncbi:Ger(x)C family spore germination protein [Paenibacillus chitinolyticus]|uniref:Ger(x)C family spore germination protein n=1 Tax=Paenibacillus chitinolyticus TaxID=79263 RepID=UPI002DB6E25D|nr:Ger(x)C family spore germination protein [Paenibacillus chitinolyticus]MEC0248849.1 Ger(x)C family spore germination protein [Paenibacillus chitinolyticus]
MKRAGRIGTVLLLLAVLPGCWDEDSLRNARLGYGAGYDLTPDGRLMQTMEVVDESKQTEQQGSAKNEVESGVGYSVRQTSDIIRTKVTGDIRYFKYGFMLLGKSVAEKDLYPYLDILYRDPRNPTSRVKIAVVDGTTNEMLRLKHVGSILIGEFITRKIESLEEMSVFPELSLETMLTLLLDPGQDFVLPYLKQDGKNVDAIGIALFNGQRMTGSLNVEEAILYSILSGAHKDTARLVRKIKEGDRSNLENYITFDAGGQKSKRKLKVQVQDRKVDVYLDLKLPVKVTEFAEDHLHKKDKVHRLNEDLSAILTRDAEAVIEKLQESGCDAFGIGRRLMARHPKLWKSMDWLQEYKNVRFHPKVNVEIVGSGVFN